MTEQDQDNEKLAELRDDLLNAEEQSNQRRWRGQTDPTLSEDAERTGGPDKDRGVI